MRRLDEFPIDPDVAASLDAIDAALAGEPVDPEHAEVAELALLVSAERPQMGATAAQSLDERVRTRFGAGAGAGRRRRAWPMMLGSMAATAAAIAVVALVLPSSNGPAPRTASTPATADKTPPSGGAASAAASSGSVSSARAALSPAPLVAPGTARQVVQSAQLQLATAPDRVDDVAQEAFDVIGSVHGYVSNSTVTQTGGSDGYANLQLTVPASSLGQTMTELSRLAHARVTSRTDGIQDVTDQYGAARRRLGDARAHRTALLKQLANAQTTEQINSLNAQIRDADAAISAAQSALASLARRIDNVQIGLAINAAAVPVAHSSGFTIGKAAHDAKWVLVVAAGVALIVLAVLVPVGLLAALLWWAGGVTRRRRREQALDAA
jgi:hypothetical protein